MRLIEAIAQNGSAQISSQFSLPLPGRYQGIPYIVAKEVFNPTERDFNTRGYVAPGKYKIIREDGPAGPIDQALEGVTDDLTICERHVEKCLKRYDPNGWQPSYGTIVHPYIRTTADYSSRMDGTW
jgi:hypothetical protein